MIQRFANVIDLVGFRHRYLPHERAAILLGAYQARFLQHTQGLADRAAARPESRGKFTFIDVLPDREFAAQNQLLDLEMHERRERVRPNQLERGGGGSHWTLVMNVKMLP